MTERVERRLWDLEQRVAALERFTEGTLIPAEFQPAPIPEPLQEILDERRRQFVDEGFGNANDDALTDQQLTHLAIRYLNSTQKPYRRRLVIAASLLLAEIERVDRSVTGGAVAEQQPMPFAHGTPRRETKVMED